MQTPYTYRDPTLSLWQSAVAQVQRNRKSVQARMSLLSSMNFAVPTLLSEETLMSPAHLLGQPLAAGQSVSPETLSSPRPSSAASPEALGVGGVVVDCAKTAAQFLWAEMTGDKQKSDLYASELGICTVCDAGGWAECLTAYLAFKASCSTLPYRPNQDVVVNLGQNATVVIISAVGEQAVPGSD